MINALLVTSLFVIELGDFSLKSVTPLSEFLWFIIGLLILAGSSAVILWWNRRSRSDPFI